MSDHGRRKGLKMTPEPHGITWVTVLQTSSLSEALLVEQMLETYGFHARLFSPTPYPLFPFSGHEQGWYRIQVQAGEESDARALIEDFQKGGTPVFTATRFVPKDT